MGLNFAVLKVWMANSFLLQCIKIAGSVFDTFRAKEDSVSE